MKKKLLDVIVKERVALNDEYVQLKFTADETLPEMKPGQFVEVKIDYSPATFLRRPFSINFFDESSNEFWLLIRAIGDGTRTLYNTKAGEKMNMILPLGNSFSLPENDAKTLLLIGGGCGTAPLLFWGAYLKKRNFKLNFLLGARSKKDLLQLEEFNKYGDVYTTTEDGSFGEKGLVLSHSALNNFSGGFIYTCGPKPMMQAVAGFAKKKNFSCEVSLENTMACGFGACLCCVENTMEGHVCVCKDGPVFNIDKLLW